MIEIEIITKDYIKYMRKFALNTIGKEADNSNVMSRELIRKYIISEHSPIRVVQIMVDMKGIPRPAAMHLRTHSQHNLHSIKTCRPDRTGKERSQKDLVDHIMIGNPQSFIDMFRQRLCVGRVEKETYELMKLIKDQMTISDDPFLSELGDLLQRNCEYRKFCPEFKSCGYWKGE
jgi:hypothetical protein